jgi:hypothetical protein
MCIPQQGVIVISAAYPITAFDPKRPLPEADLNVGEEWESVFIGLKPFCTRNSRRMRPRTGASASVVCLPTSPSVFENG